MLIFYISRFSHRDTDYVGHIFYLLVKCTYQRNAKLDINLHLIGWWHFAAQCAIFPGDPAE